MESVKPGKFDVSLANETRPSLLPAGTAQLGPPVCIKQTIKSILISLICMYKYIYNNSGNNVTDRSYQYVLSAIGDYEIVIVIIL